MNRILAAPLLALVGLLVLGPAATPAAPLDDAARTLGVAQPPSLLGAESLRGGSAAQAWAGYSALGARYGQGITAADDLTGSVDFDWSSTELLLAGGWRRQLGQVGGWDLAARLQLGWYLNFGGTWIHSDNLADRGLQIDPGATLSTRAGDGLVSVTGSFPVTFTSWRTGGFLLGPKVAVGYETLLYGDLTLGVRTAVSWRGGGGDAPMRSGRVEPELLVLATYRIF